MFNSGERSDKADRRQGAVSAAPGFQFGLFDIIHAMVSRKALMILLPLLFAGLAAFVARSMPNTYESTAQILIDPRELRVLEKDVLPQGVQGDASAAFLESQARIITSTNMLRRIVEQEKLVDDTEFIPAPTALDRWLGISDIPMDKTLAAVAALSKKLTVRRGEKTFVIDIAVDTESPEKSAKLANAFVAAYLADQRESRSSVTRRTSASLTGRLEELQTRVRNAEDKVEAYRRERGIVDANGRRVTDEQLASASAQIASARSRLADAKSKLEQIERVGQSLAASSTLPEAVNSATLGILRQQLGDAERRAANLSITLGNRHPDYLSALAVKRDAERAVRDEIGRIKAAARVEFQRAEANEKDLSSQVEVLKKATLATSADAVKLRELQREVEASRGLYQAFLQRSLETGEQDNIDPTNTRIITEAVPPLEKSGPNRKLLIAIAGMAGAALAAGIAIMLELFRKFRAYSLATRRAAQAQPVEVLSSTPASIPSAPVAMPQTMIRPAPVSAMPKQPANDAGPISMASGQGSVQDKETYAQLMRIMHKIEAIEDTMRRRQNRSAA
jgi:uncharacterized protein involved in exopolysaccharide biosynthesis